ncbi:MAG: hypothetical protein AB7O59_03910 [Pirellulales bacterium]
MSESEKKIADTPSKSNRSGCGATAIAIIALVISLVAVLQYWIAEHRFSSDPGGSYMTFIGPEGDRVGHILDDYGNGFILRRVDPKLARRIEMMFGDEGVSIVLYRNEVAVARWALTDDGEKFEKLPHAPHP